jgi:hypothetical protein
MRIGSIITRAIISGAIQAAKNVAREEARKNQSSYRPVTAAETRSKATGTAASAAAASVRKALRATGIIDGLLEQTRDKWLAGFRAGFDQDPAVGKEIAQRNIHLLYVHLKNEGFPCDSDGAFWSAVSDIQFELMLHKAFPEAWQNWTENLDSKLERAADRAKEIAGEHRVETLAKLAPDGRLPLDSAVVNERLMSAIGGLFAEAILPRLAAEGLLEQGNLLFTARFGSLVPKAVLADMMEFASELSNAPRY